jgi:predicted nicotinamide N-methyase
MYLRARMRTHDLIEEAVVAGDLRLRILRPRDPEALIDEREFERDEFIPYWAELWPTAVELARMVAAMKLAGASVLELGCGLAVPSIVAAMRGASVFATDWADAALALAQDNARRNGVEMEPLLVDWRTPDPLLERAPFDLVLASDVLYERRNVEPLVSLLPLLARRALVADPGRPYASEFADAAAATWNIELDGRVYRLLR